MLARIASFKKTERKLKPGQIELVEEQTGNMDPKTNFSLIVIQTELERFKFLVRSFLRSRIAKVRRCTALLRPTRR